MSSNRRISRYYCRSTEQFVRRWWLSECRYAEGLFQAIKGNSKGSELKNSIKAARQQRSQFLSCGLPTEFCYQNPVAVVKVLSLSEDKLSSFGCIISNPNLSATIRVVVIDDSDFLFSRFLQFAHLCYIFCATNVIRTPVYGVRVIELLQLLLPVKLLLLRTCKGVYNQIYRNVTA